jgi:hypothetical protein
MLRFLFRAWLWLRAEIVFGFLIATVFWAAVLGWQAAYAPTDAQKQQCYDAAERSGHKTEECKSIWERTTSDPVAFFTFWLVISTVGLGASTLLLWFAGERQLRHARRSAAIQSRDMRASIEAAKQSAAVAGYAAEAAHKSNKIAKETAERQLRAYVLPQKAVAKVMKLGHSPEIRVEFRNSGQTPAYGLTNNMQGGFQRPGDPDAVLKWGDRVSKATVAPNTKLIAFGGETTMLPLTQASFDGVKEGRFIFYVCGETRYTDAFGNNRTTRYRYMFDDRTGLREGRMMAAPYGNSAD